MPMGFHFKTFFFKMLFLTLVVFLLHQKFSGGSRWQLSATLVNDKYGKSR